MCLDIAILILWQESHKNHCNINCETFGREKQVEVHAKKLKVRLPRVCQLLMMTNLGSYLACA